MNSEDLWSLSWKCFKALNTKKGQPRHTMWLTTPYPEECQDTKDMPKASYQGDPISPYLFVILMEYLLRCLHHMQLDPKFNHHSKCQKLQLTNLMFSDDVLLLSRGDTLSVELLLTAFTKFLNSTGVQTNKTKSNLYFGAVPNDVKDNIFNLTGFKEGGLPFKYLGVPISCKKLASHHYMDLIEKILLRIRHWTAKLLSYAGRLQLIKSVSFAIVNYWLACFPIPKNVISKIDVICRSYLWTGKDSISCKSLMA
ncbi:uncharacterized protein LOC131598614 [Vicia villosa]|uniref:uncharacterized protein LOC131598614 n=1 Tax=Vicia villosa TaxID=3911 RepID=UPI00273C5768|nr:uncharacterized protein LOC131598614 [Vicia villosa]